MKKQMYLLLSIIAVVSLLFVGVSSSVSAKPLGATAPNLGVAGNFSALAALAASSATTTTISQNLGLFPGEASSKTGNWVVGGSEYYGPGTLAEDAQASALSAYGNLAGQGSDGAWGPTNPAPGVYTSDSSITSTGDLILDGGYNDVWVFQAGSSLSFSGSVVLTGNAQACHVFWQVGSSATIESGASFVGTLIASEDITLVDGATVQGRVIALNGSLTTDNNTISVPGCSRAPKPDTSDDDEEATLIPTVDSLPSTGGAPLSSDVFPWGAVVVGSFSTLGLFALIVIAIRRGNQ